MKDVLIGIDIGTSACKAVAFDSGGRVLSTAGATYQTTYPKPGWAEQNPDEWWEAVCSALKRLTLGIRAEEIRGIGVCGQSWSAIPMDKQGNVLANTPIWMDTRADDICEELKAEFGEELFFECSGNPLKPSYTLPKILWYKKYLPKVYASADTILQCNSFIAYRLTGAITQDKSQGYGLSCYNTKEGRWDKVLCERLGIRPTLLPPLVDCDAVIGHVTAEAADRCGLPIGIPVVAGGLDAACGTLGVGVIHPGETQEQGGQAGGMSIATDNYAADKRLILGNHVVPGLWLLQGGTVGGGGIMNWFEREFGAKERAEAEKSGKNAFQIMDEEAEEIPAGSEGLVFLPYMAGERSPIWDPKAKGVYYGADYAKTRAHFIRASMEGAAFALKDNLDTALGAGAVVSELRAMGGAANSRVWTQMKADITGMPIVVPSADTATALGAAILAGVGTKVYASYEEAVKKTVTAEKSYVPNAQRHAEYAKAYEIYKALYQNLKGLMHSQW